MVFGERRLHADVGVDVAIGDVVDDLANGPTAVAVGGVELGFGEAGHGNSQGSWRDGDFIYPGDALVGRYRFGRDIGADRET